MKKRPELPSATFTLQQLLADYHIVRNTFINTYIGKWGHPGPCNLDPKTGKPIGGKLLYAAHEVGHWRKHLMPDMVAEIPDLEWRAAAERAAHLRKSPAKKK